MVTQAEEQKTTVGQLLMDTVGEKLVSSVDINKTYDIEKEEPWMKV